MRGDTGSYRRNNCLVGKFGEAGASIMLGGEMACDVWATGSRRGLQFDPDITTVKGPFSSYNIHVKTCHMKHGRLIDGTTLLPSASASWTIDASDPVMLCPSSSDIIVLMFANEQGDVFGLGWVYALDVACLWKPCRSPYMRHKRAIYFPDIKWGTRWFPYHPSL